MPLSFSATSYPFLIQCLAHVLVISVLEIEEIVAWLVFFLKVKLFVSLLKSGSLVIDKVEEFVLNFLETVYYPTLGFQ